MLATNTHTEIKAAAVRMVTIARDAGVPEDSMRRFLSASYVPQPKQMLFHAACRLADSENAPNEIGYGGALAGGKTHCAFAQIGIDDCQRFPNLKVLFLRKVGKYAKESLEDLRRSVLGYVPHDFKNNVIHYENNSRIIIGSYQYEKDIDNYLSLEYDVILIEQAEQLSGKKLDLIRTRNRSSKGFRPRMYYTFNPGGVGHVNLKQKFIKPFRDEKETTTKFIFANYKDNCFVNKEYQETLDSLSGWQRAAWRDGDWDIAAGQYFSTWRHDVHVKSTVKIMPGAVVWCALDYGFTHPTSCHLLTEYDGKTGVVDEYWKQKSLVPQNATGIKEMLARNGVPLSRLRSFVAGADVFANRGDEQGKTIAMQYQDQGITLTPANTDRINGAGQILSLLGDIEAGIEPRLEIAERCSRLIECIPALQHDPHRPEDVLKVDVDEDGNGGDDPYDDLRYGVMARTKETKRPQLPGTSGYSVFGN
jgi:phage terminase large subunit